MWDIYIIDTDHQPEVISLFMIDGTVKDKAQCTGIMDTTLILQAII